jgi:hypothetical protein
VACGVDDAAFGFLELQHIARLDAIHAQPFDKALKVVAAHLDLSAPKNMAGGMHEGDLQRGLR